MTRRPRRARAVRTAGLTLLALMVLAAAAQTALFFHARSVAATAAAEAARHVATSTVSPAAGAAEAQRAIRAELGGVDRRSIACVAVPTRDADSGLSGVTVRCRGRIHLLFSALTLPVDVDVSSHALHEEG